MKTKFKFKAIFMLLFFSNLFSIMDALSQTPNWVWAKKAGDFNNDISRSVATDSSGNVYVAGGFASSSITFGTFILFNDSNGTSDMFIVKYDCNGNVIWAKREGGKSNEVALSITADAFGNIYVAGNFESSTITFDAISLNNAGNRDIFIAKYDTSGNVIWAKRAGGIDEEDAYSVTTDAIGNIYVAGRFRSDTLTFDSITLVNTMNAIVNMYIVKYDINGNAIWAKTATGNTFNGANSVSTDSFGNIYVVGYFSYSSITFGAITLSVIGNGDIFIVKYNGSGNVIWAKGSGGANSDIATAVTADALGNIYVTGYFSSPTLIFDSDTLTNANVGIYDIFIVKYESNGNVLWARKSGGNGNDVGISITKDVAGNIYVGGAFESNTMNFASSTLTNNTGAYNILIEKYSDSGNEIWAKTTDGGDGYVYSLISDITGNIYVTGYFYGAITFGTIALGATGNNYDMYIAKLGEITGINEQNSNELFLYAYPNPFTDELSISGTKEKGEVIIFDLTGREIMRQNTFDNETKIKTKNLISGFYLFNYIEENKTVKIKLPILFKRY